MGSILLPVLMLVPIAPGGAGTAAESPPAAGPASAPRTPFTVVETGEGFFSLDTAVKSIGDGSGTIRIAPGRYSDCAVQEGGQVSYIAERPGSVIFDGAICEGKATLVLRGRGARVDGLTFIHTTVPDGNGAGIRAEKGDLFVTRSHFLDGQCGILSANGVNATIRIDRSTFAGLGKHPDGTGAHSVYIGDYGAVEISNSRFERGTGGHYVKSRAARVSIRNSSFDDSQGRDTNYMIDLPNGATGDIIGNVFANGLRKENYATMIAVAAEGAQRSSTGLVIAGNRATLAPDSPWNSTFVGTWSQDALVLRSNQLGTGIKDQGSR